MRYNVNPEPSRGKQYRNPAKRHIARRKKIKRRLRKRFKVSMRWRDGKLRFSKTGRRVPGSPVIKKPKRPPVADPWSVNSWGFP